jgi:hypothetical protein
MIVVIVYRHQFYLHARLDLQEGRLKVNDWRITTKFVALMVQAECGDFEPLASPQLHCFYLEQCSQLCGGEDSKPPDVLHKVSLEHEKLKVSLYLMLDMTQYKICSCKHDFLLVSCIALYIICTWFGSFLERSTSTINWCYTRAIQ